MGWPVAGQVGVAGQGRFSGDSVTLRTVFSAEAGAVDVLAMAVEEVCQQELCSLRRRLRFRLCMALAPRSARARVGDRRAERSARPQQADRQAARLWVCAGEARLWQPEKTGRRSEPRARSRRCEERRAHVGPGVQAQSGGAAAAAVQVPGAARHLVGFDRRTVSERFEGYTFWN